MNLEFSDDNFPTELRGGGGGGCAGYPYGINVSLDKKFSHFIPFQNLEFIFIYLYLVSHSIFAGYNRMYTQTVFSISRVE